MLEEPGRRTLLAFFTSRARAEAAREALARVGFHGLQIERVSRYDSDGTSILTNPLTGSFTSLPAGREESQEEGLFMAADPPAGEPAGGSDLQEKGYLLTVICSDKDASQAEAILRQEGALL